MGRASRLLRRWVWVFGEKTSREVGGSLLVISIGVSDEQRPEPGTERTTSTQSRRVDDRIRVVRFEIYTRQSDASQQEERRTCQQRRLIFIAARRSAKWDLMLVLSLDDGCDRLRVRRHASAAL